MPAHPEFEIGGKRYPAPSAFRLVDAVLVESLTGLEWLEWADRLPDEDGKDPRTGAESTDPIVVLGMVAMAIWQANPTWRRDRAIKFVEGLRLEDVKLIAPETGEEGDERPPAKAATQGAPSTTSAETSKEPLESGSAQTLVSSGSPGSATGSPA